MTRQEKIEALLARTRRSLRLSSEDFDDELLGYLRAFETKLKIGGTRYPDLARGYIGEMFIVYTKMMMNYQGRADEWRQMFIDMSHSSALSGLYEVAPNENE